MARRKKAVTGLINELAAQLNLAKDPNILVFLAGLVVAVIGFFKWNG